MSSISYLALRGLLNDLFDHAANADKKPVAHVQVSWEHVQHARQDAQAATDALHTAYVEHHDAPRNALKEQQATWQEGFAAARTAYAKAVVTERPAKFREWMGFAASVNDVATPLDVVFTAHET